jgi:pyruvate kinase
MSDLLRAGVHVKPCTVGLRTTIVASLGPASRSVATLEAMLREGMALARLNLAYETRELHAETLANLRAALVNTRGVCGVLVSLAGHAVRTVPGPAAASAVLLAQGQIFTWLTLASTAAPSDAPGPSCARLDCPEDFATLVSVGDSLVVDDGLLRFTVLEKLPGRLLCSVAVGGPLPVAVAKRVVVAKADGSPVRIPSAERLARERDIADAKWAVEQGADFLDGDLDSATFQAIVGDSGVRVLQRISSDDVVADALQSDGREPLVAGTLLLRRQLGTMRPISGVPSEQRALAEHALVINRPLFIAAELLESMVRNPRPTRAEVSDAINAIIEGAHGLVLTAESAVGRNPVAVVRQLRQLCVEAESVIDYRAEYIEHRRRVLVPLEDKNLSLASTAALCARDIGCERLLMIEPSPELSRAVSQFRGCSVAHFCTDARTAKQAMLLHGRVTVLDSECTKKTTQQCIELLVEIGFLKPGQSIVVLTNDTMEVFHAN